MLTERERASKEMRLEYARMQRAMFIAWLANRGPDVRQELEQAAKEAAQGAARRWEDVRQEMNAKFST